MSEQKMTEQDLAMFAELYPKIGAAVAERLSVKRSAGALRSLAFRMGLKLEDKGAPHRSHGMVGTRTYKAWFAAKQRCRNPESEAYPAYGGAGIDFYSGWDRFEDFLAAVGEAPSARHQIDRIDSAKGYVPGNVRWATPSQNAANTRSKSRTGYRGVDQLPSGRYRAAICQNGRKVGLGTFDTAEEAAEAYDRKAVDVFGEFAMLNSRRMAVSGDGGAHG